MTMTDTVSTVNTGLPACYICGERIHHGEAWEHVTITWHHNGHESSRVSHNRCESALFGDVPEPARATITVKSATAVTRWPCALRVADACRGWTAKSEVIAVIEPDPDDGYVCEHCLHTVSPELVRFASDLEDRIALPLDPTDEQLDRRVAALDDTRTAEVEVPR